MVMPTLQCAISSLARVSSRLGSPIGKRCLAKKRKKNVAWRGTHCAGQALVPSDGRRVLRLAYAITYGGLLGPSKGVCELRCLAVVDSLRREERSTGARGRDRRTTSCDPRHHHMLIGLFDAEARPEFAMLSKIKQTGKPYVMEVLLVPSIGTRTLLPYEVGEACPRGKSHIHPHTHEDHTRSRRHPNLAAAGWTTPPHRKEGTRKATTIAKLMPGARLV